MLPTLFVVHSTRSGRRDFTDDQEREATLRWFQNNLHFVSAHFVADAAGGLTEVVPLNRVAQHAGQHNPYSVGVELTQPTIDREYTEGHYQAAALAFRRANEWLVVQGAAPIRPVLAGGTQIGCAGHDQTEQGKRAGKTDPGPLWDWGRFLAMARH